ncbi:MAG: hypothetical protein KDD60_06575 [Bdellovibrionales bacterium]|nr:hypothetical protein [Bdellovibrionales bacterium]
MAFNSAIQPSRELKTPPLRQEIPLWPEPLNRKLLGAEKFIVDFGCGDCRVTAELARLSPRNFILGVDQSCPRGTLLLEPFESKELMNAVGVHGDMKHFDFDTLGRYPDEIYMIFPTPTELAKSALSIASQFISLATKNSDLKITIVTEISISREPVATDAASSGLRNMIDHLEAKGFTSTIQAAPASHVAEAFILQNSHGWASYVRWLKAAVEEGLCDAEAVFPVQLSRIELRAPYRLPIQHPTPQPPLSHEEPIVAL